MKSAWAIYSVSLCLKEPREKRWRRRGEEKRRRESREGERTQNWPLASMEGFVLEAPNPLADHFSRIPRGGWVKASSLFLIQRFRLELCEFTPGLQRQAAGILEQDPRGHDLSVMSLSKLHLWATCTDKPG